MHTYKNTYLEIKQTLPELCGFTSWLLEMKSDVNLIRKAMQL